MSQINDAILAATGGPTVNEGLLLHYIDGGATSDDLQDAEREFLLSAGIPSASNQDMWFEHLGILGLTGSLDDRKLAYWLSVSDGCALNGTFDFRVRVGLNTIDYTAGYGYSLGNPTTGTVCVRESLIPEVPITIIFDPVDLFIEFTFPGGQINDIENVEFTIQNRSGRRTVTWNGSAYRLDVAADDEFVDFVVSRLGGDIQIGIRVINFYSPIETHPDWSLIGDQTPVTNTEYFRNIDGVNIFSFIGSTVPERAVAFGDLNVADVRLSCRLTANFSNGTGSGSFFLAIRIIDWQNFLGIRFYGNRWEIFERIGGSFNRLGNFTRASNEVGDIIYIEAVGDSVTLGRRNGDVIDVRETSHLAAGRVGIIARGWATSRREITEDYFVT